MKLTNSDYLKRNFKDSLFTHLFAIEYYRWLLYKALHPEDETTRPEDIVDATLNNVVTNQIYNDLAFRVGDRLIVMVEAQSEWDPNIPLRAFFYLADLLSKYLKANGIGLHCGDIIELPEIELYVLYTGDERDLPSVVSLTETYYDGRTVSFDVRVNVISAGRPGDAI